MRSDATRNLELILSTRARLLAEDPSASIAAIAEAANVDRRAIYRRFTSREELLAAVHSARYDAVGRAIDAARLREAPVAVVLHLYIDGIIAVNRAWPVVMRSVLADQQVTEHRTLPIKQHDAVIARTTDEGLLRSDVAAGWVGAVLQSLMLHAAVGLLTSPQRGPPTWWSRR